MNMKALLGLVAIIVVGVGAFVLFGHSAGTQPGMVDNSKQPVVSMSLHSLLTGGQSTTCTYSTTTADGTKTDVTAYIASGGMMRANMMSQTKAGAIQSHMILRDKTNYIWTSMSAQGFKSTINPQAAADAAQGRGIDYNTPMDYQCAPWTVDQSIFTLPTGITFVDMPTASTGATVKGPAVSIPSIHGTSAQCAACQQLGGAAKAQCLAALQCQ